MEKAWYWKVSFVMVLLLGSVLYLLPSLVPNALPNWYKSVFTKRINLGLDLQGGIHLVLGVELEKALQDKSDQYAGDFKEMMKDKRIAFDRVFRVPGSWDIRIELKNPGDEKKFRKRILDEYYFLTDVDLDDEKPGVIQVTFRENHVKDLRRNARDQSLVTINNRVDELGVTMPNIAPHGEEGILVQLPGMFDPERAKSLLGRTAQLEFKLVDDRSDFIKGLKDQLPEDIRMDYNTYKGPNDEPITETFLLARGKGTEGRNRLFDFFNNVKEIEAFLGEQTIDAKIQKEILILLKGGLDEDEKKQILTLAGQVEAGSSQTEEPAEAAEETEKAEATAEAKPEPKKAVGQSDFVTKLAKLLEGKVPYDREIGMERKEYDLEIEYRTYYLVRETALTGDYITDASVQNDPSTGQPEVSLNFDRPGARKFEKLTGAHVRERMAIVLEGEVSSAPVIQGRIGGGRARITMGSSRDYNATLAESRDLAVVLRAGALPAPVRILEERTVGPTMGEDARTRGIEALVIGLVLVLLFMVFYYRLSGLVADFALVVNAVFIMAVMAAFQATLTLPGIAGIILTIGMAVDANVIINERIREELRAGKTPRAAVDAGYSRAFWTIFDASFTTLIAAVVLWSYGSGPIQGFAVTLFIGILASMFTAIFVTRLVVDYLTVRLKVKHLSIG